MNSIAKSDADPVAIGHVLRVWRAEKSMTQKDVAEKLGISAQQFQKYESGASGIELSRLFEICRIFGKSPSELLNNESSTQKIRGQGNTVNDEKSDQHALSPTLAFARSDAETTSQFDISFQISELVSEFLAIKHPEDKALAIQILRSIARK